MKKRYWVVPAALLLLAGMYIGNNDQQKLSSTEKNEVIIRAKNFIRRINRIEYQGCYSLFDENLKSSMTLEQMTHTFDKILDSLGDFEKFKGISINLHESLGEEYVVCAIKCDYSMGVATYTISFNQKLEIGGLYIK